MFGKWVAMKQKNSWCSLCSCDNTILKRSKIDRIKTIENVKQKPAFVIVYDVCVHTHTYTKRNRWAVWNSLKFKSFGTFVQNAQPPIKVDYRFDC